MITFLALAACTHVGCYALVWGRGDDNVPCTCTHVGCYATGLGWGGMIAFLALAHMLDATQLVWQITFLALAHMLDATQLVWGGGDDNVPGACAHVGFHPTGDNVPCICTHVGW